MHHTRKNRRGSVTRGWKKEQPNDRQQTKMLQTCGKKCFLGPNKSFPICTKNTCKINKKGLYAAYIRAREYMTIKGTKKYTRISNKAKLLINKKKLK
jgi:hypothetical protein